jgi:hypothetical protein
VLEDAQPQRPFCRELDVRSNAQKSRVHRQGGAELLELPVAAHVRQRAVERQESVLRRHEGVLVYDHRTLFSGAGIASRSSASASCGR